MAPELKKNAAQVAVIGAVALLSRQIYLDQMGQDPLFDVVVGSAESYVYLAQQELPWAVSAEETPAFLYALFLNTLFRLFGESSIHHVRDVQAVIGALNCLLLWSLARALASHRVALITGLASALYGPFIYFDGALRPTVLAVFFSLLALHALVWALRMRRSEAFCLAGALSGCAALAGAHVLLFALIAAGWLWRRGSAAGAAGMLLGFAAVSLAGAWAHGWPWSLHDLSVSAAEFYDFCRGREVLVDDPYYASGFSPLLAALMWVRGLAFPFGLVGPLALVGISSRLRNHDRSPAETALLLFVGTGAISGMLLEADASGRAVIVPVLLLIAVAGVCSWIDAGRQVRRLNLGAFILLCVALNLYQGVPSVVAAQHHWRGEAYARRGMNINAQREYAAAVSHGSEHVDSYLSLAAIYTDGNDFDSAAAVYQKLLERWPDHSGAGRGLAAAYMSSERFAEALVAYEGMIAVDPDFALTRLAQARLRLDDRPGAIRAFEELLIRQPENGRVRYLTALLYLQEEQRADAAQAYRQLLSNPEWREKAGLRLARLLVEAGSPAEAESLLRRILSEVNPDSELAMAQMGRLHYERRQFEEALVYLERLRRLKTEVHQTYFYLSAIYREAGRDGEAEETMKLYERFRLEKHRADLEQRVEEESSQMLRKIMETMP